MGVADILAGGIESISQSGQRVPGLEHVAAMFGGIFPALDRLINGTVTNTDVFTCGFFKANRKDPRLEIGTRPYVMTVFSRCAHPVGMLLRCLLQARVHLKSDQISFRAFRIQPGKTFRDIEINRPGRNFRTQACLNITCGDERASLQGN